MLSVYLKNFKNRLWIINLQENILENFYFLKIYPTHTLNHISLLIESVFSFFSLLHLANFQPLMKL